MIKIFQRFTIIFSVGSLLLFLIIPFFRWRYTDDFAFAVELDQQNLFNMLLDNYLNWDARFLTPFGILWFASMKFLHHKVLLFLSSLSLVGVSYYIVRLFVNLSEHTISRYYSIVLTALMNGIIFLLFYHVHSNLTYWVSGSAYIHSLLFAMIWLNIYISKKPNTISFFIFTFFVATLSQNITVGLIVLVFIDWIVNDKKEYSKFYRNTFLIFVAGILLATFSPGSFVQLKLMQSTSYSEVYSPTLQDYIKHFFKLYIEALKPNLLLFVFLPFLFSSIFKAFLFKKSIIHKISLFDGMVFRWNELRNALERYKYYFAAIFALAVYWPTLLYGDRYYIGFYLFLLLGLLRYWLKTANIERAVNISSFKVHFLVLLLIGISTIYYTKTLFESVMVYKFISEREQLLEKNRGIESITLPVLDFGEFTRTIKTPEITKDPIFFPNSTLALYFGIDSIYAGNIIRKRELK